MLLSVKFNHINKYNEKDHTQRSSKTPVSRRNHIPNSLWDNPEFKGERNYCFSILLRHSRTECANR